MHVVAEPAAWLVTNSGTLPVADFDSCKNTNPGRVCCIRPCHGQRLATKTALASSTMLHTLTLCKTCCFTAELLPSRSPSPPAALPEQGQDPATSNGLNAAVTAPRALMKAALMPQTQPCHIHPLGANMIHYTNRRVVKSSAFNIPRTFLMSAFPSIKSGSHLTLQVKVPKEAAAAAAVAAAVAAALPVLLKGCNVQLLSNSSSSSHVPGWPEMEVVAKAERVRYAEHQSDGSTYLCARLINLRQALRPYLHWRIVMISKVSWVSVGSPTGTQWSHLSQ